MRNKKIFFTTVLPVLLSLITGVLIIAINNNFVLKSKAKATVVSEKKEFVNNINKLKKEKKTLEKEADRYDAQLKESTQLAEEIETLKATLDGYTTDINSATAVLAELDSLIMEKQAYYNSLADVKTEITGNTISLRSGDYKCPSDLKAGRYTAEGKGKIYFYSIANTLNDKVDLSTTDSHSYTFNITAGESIKIDGSVTLKKIDTQN